MTDAQQLKPGIAVDLDGTKYILRPVRQSFLKQWRDDFNLIWKQQQPSTEFMEAAIAQAFKDNYPHLSEDQILDLYSFGDFTSLFAIALDGDYALRKKLKAEQPDATNPEMTLTGTAITPLSPLAPAGHSTESTI